MKYLQGNFPLVSKKNLARDIFDFTVHCPEIAEKAQPGQFVHIGLPGHSLRRPISICGIDRKNGNIRLVFAVKGSGTRQLSDFNEGMTVDILGPLGHGFTLLPEGSRVITVGGGIGTPPLVEISRRYGKNCAAISGFRTASAVILQDDLAANGSQTIVTTEDGSQGIKGFVTAPLEELLKTGKYDMIYACGPEAMLRAVAKTAEKYDAPCEVSLEQHMGCGIGACLVCTCKIRVRGELEYKHVCKDGPVFNAKEVEWNG